MFHLVSVLNITQGSWIVKVVDFRTNWKRYAQFILIFHNHLFLTNRDGQASISGYESNDNIELHWKHYHLTTITIKTFIIIFALSLPSNVNILLAVTMSAGTNFQQYGSQLKKELFYSASSPSIDLSTLFREK